MGTGWITLLSKQKVDICGTFCYTRSPWDSGSSDVGLERHAEGSGSSSSAAIVMRRSGSGSGSDVANALRRSGSDVIKNALRRSGSDLSGSAGKKSKQNQILVLVEDMLRVDASRRPRADAVLNRLQMSRYRF